MSYATDQGVINAQWNAANMGFSAEEARVAPHVLMRPAVYPDGDQWCALYGPNLMEGVSGFGETPAAACAAFDEAWRSQRTPAAARAKSEVGP